MLNTLIGPLLFALFGGLWAYVYRPARRHELLVTLLLMMMVGLYGYAHERSVELFGLLCLLALSIFGMLLHLLLHAPHSQQRR